MTHLGGGAEAHARFKQYEYRANSSLVLTTDSRPRDTHEPTGEPESLWGKIDPKSFGDRAYRGKPPKLENKIKRSKQKEREPGPDHERRKNSKRRRVQEENDFSLADEGVYQPKTKVTRAAYEALLPIIAQQLGLQPPGVIIGAADEVLAILKNDKIKNPEKKDIERLLYPFSNQTFDQLVSIAQLITDYQDGPETAGPLAANGNDGALYDGIGVDVEFEEHDEEESDYDQEIQEESEEDDDGQEPNDMGAMQMSGIDEEEMKETNDGQTLNARDIDRDQRFMEREADNNWSKGQLQLLNLNTLAFQKGGLLMANNKFELPPISYRTPHKGFPM